MDANQPNEYDEQLMLEWEKSSPEQRADWIKYNKSDLPKAIADRYHEEGIEEANDPTDLAGGGIKGGLRMAVKQGAATLAKDKLKDYVKAETGKLVYNPKYQTGTGNITDATTGWKSNLKSMRMP